MDMVGAIAADAGIITGGAEVVATTMVGGIIVITGNLTVTTTVVENGMFKTKTEAKPV